MCLRLAIISFLTCTDSLEQLIKHHLSSITFYKLAQILHLDNNTADGERKRFGARRTFYRLLNIFANDPAEHKEPPLIETAVAVASCRLPTLDNV